MPPAIIIDHIEKSFRGMSRKALDDVSFTMEAGCVTGIIGPNGAGKTTLMGCLLGLLIPDKGQILVRGLSPRTPQIRRFFGYVPERLTFDRWMRAWDFVAFHHELAKLPRLTRKKDVAMALERVGLDTECWKRPIRSFSRGMLQRLGLAQATLGNPQYIFLDEPTSGMDPDGVILFKSLIKEKAAAGALVVLNSHQLPQVEELCDRVCFLKRGHIGSELSQNDLRNEGKFILRWRPGVRAINAKFLKGLAAESHCILTAYQSGSAEASFLAHGEAERAALIGEAIKRGLALIEATLETKSLESLFEEPS